MELEPGETEQIDFDFIIPPLEVIEVYSHVNNEQKRKKEIGWNLTTVKDIRSTSLLDGPDKE